MLIEVYLGTRWNTEPIKIQAAALDRFVEFNPDDIFDALNRVGSSDPYATPQEHDEADIERIYARHPGSEKVGWRLTLKMLRRRMDHAGAPSMSVEDRIVVSRMNDNAEREDLVEYVCESIGWTTKAPAPAV